MDSNLQPAALRRLETTLGHIHPEEKSSLFLSDTKATQKDDKKVVRTGYNRREAELKWNGWGYSDTGFEFTEDGTIKLSGVRYDLSGKTFPLFKPWAETKVGWNMSYHLPGREAPPPLPPSIKNQNFLDELKSLESFFSFEDVSRLLHAHGHTCQDIYRLRYGEFARVPDAVFYPTRTEHVQQIVSAATKHNVVIIPYGGGTSVTHALECPADEKRMIISVDMHDMNQLKWVDKKSLMVCVEAGIVGKDLEKKLAVHGLCLGHEPDSVEFSTVGGWIATRASGMKKNIYGNIEDILLRVKLVTPIGTLEKSTQLPRLSAGPDLNHFILGSEGILGIITEAVLKVRPLPEEKRYGSIVFRCFEDGVACMKEIAQKRLAPASIRLMDNAQFFFGMALKTPDNSRFAPAFEALKRLYITKWKNIDLNQLTVATLLFEGDSAAIRLQEKAVYAIAAKHGGFAAGEENGKRGYNLTFMIAYLRDFSLDFQFLAESFETTVSWGNLLLLVTKVKDRISKSAKQIGFPEEPFVCCRVTQTYDSGACVYFYFALNIRGVSDPLEKYTQVEEEAREEVLACGGSVSHHHGIGKLRKHFFPSSVSPPSLEAFKAIKQRLDPNNIFASGNLFSVAAPETHE